MGVVIGVLGVQASSQGFVIWIPTNSLRILHRTSHLRQIVRARKILFVTCVGTSSSGVDLKKSTFRLEGHGHRLPWGERWDAPT